MKTALTVPTLLLCLALSAQAERAALVIGNADYAGTGLFPDLATTTLDAREMERLLKSAGTFDRIVVREDVTRLEMEDALAQFAGGLKKGDEAVFYFAGHGVEYERKVYLMGTNAEFRLKAKLAEEAVSEETVSQTLAATGAKISVLLLDCCRQKPGGDWLASENKSRGGPGGHAAPAPPPNVIVGYATSAGRLANDSLGSGDQNGPLVNALKKHWSTGLEFDALWKAVSREVYESSEKALGSGTTGIDLQMPSKYGQTIHDFYFAKPGAPGSTPPPTFAGDVAQIFQGKCLRCHDEEKGKGDLRLDAYAFVMKGGQSGPSIKPGSPKDSLIWQRITLPLDDDEHMPPESKEQLTAQEITTITRWLEAGALAPAGDGGAKTPGVVQPVPKTPVLVQPPAPGGLPIQQPGAGRVVQ